MDNTSQSNDKSFCLSLTPHEKGDSETLRNLQVAPTSMIGKVILGMEARIQRLILIENAALRVASSRRDGVVMDRAALDALDKVLETP